MTKLRKRSVSAIDLFCGAGGLTYGFTTEGISVKAGYDIDPKCEFPFVANNPGAKFVNADIEFLSADSLNKHFENDDIRVLAGCAPCQPFSRFRHAYERQRHEAVEKGLSNELVHDKKWDLLQSFGRLVSEIDVDVVTMENVPQLRRHAVFNDFVGTLRRKGYHVTSEIIDCSKYGVPQRRKRLVVLASKFGELELLRPAADATSNTVMATIKDLPPIAAGSENDADPLHKAKALSDLNLRRIIASKQRGSWEDWDESLLPECYKRPTGRTFKSVYGRMSWNEPAPVVTTQFHTYGTGRFGHPEQNRALSLREGALLQTFPRTYKFVEEHKPIQFTPVGRMIGNAVPPRLAGVIARSILEHLDVHAEHE